MVLDSGHAYQAGGAVYFSVASWPKFGQVSHYTREQMLEYARERGGNVDDPNKQDPLDFVLWQPSAEGEPWWESLWGRGRPGWHIECSALAMRELGETIDLHGGGGDLIFPHHECEAAQSEAATGAPFVRHWMHQGMVRLDGEKMSKSLGNLVFAEQLCKEWDPAAIRLACLSNHYRPGWDWDDELMPTAAARLAAWRAGGTATRRWTTCGPVLTTTSTRPARSPRSTPRPRQATACRKRQRYSASLSSAPTREGRRARGRAHRGCCPRRRRVPRPRRRWSRASPPPTPCWRSAPPPRWPTTATRSRRPSTRRRQRRFATRSSAASTAWRRCPSPHWRTPRSTRRRPHHGGQPRRVWRCAGATRRDHARVDVHLRRPPGDRRHVLDLRQARRQVVRRR